MPEPGGPTTQAGIAYQNSVAALAMLDLLDAAPSPANQRVTDVRVEAPEQVDDIVIRYADGTKTHQNVKLKLDRRGEPWKGLWAQLHAQRNAAFGEHDELQVVVSEQNQLFEDCAALADRSHAENVQEWVDRLTTDQVTILDDIVKHVGARGSALEILQKTTFLYWSEDFIQSEFARRRLAAGAGGPSTLLSTLRDIVSGGARHRTLYRAGPLRSRLQLEHGIRIADPPEWGLAAYRAALQSLGRISIPGTTRSGSVDELFVWPTARVSQLNGLRDFEDEDLGTWREPEVNDVDLRDFPQPAFDRLVVIAGPGCGKSALLTALATRMAPGPVVPVKIPLPLLAASGRNLLGFVEEYVKDEFNVVPAWQRLAEQGLLVLLLDGLDEVPPSQRPGVVRRLATFSSLYEHCPWLLTARDPAVVPGLPDAQQLELNPLADNDIVEFVKVIARQLDDVDATQFVRQLRLYPDLNRLARIPLFLTMLLATTDARDLEPTKRSDLIEAYLKTLISPEEYKEAQAANQAPHLRAIAQDIAFRRIEAQEIGVSEAEVRAVIAEHTEDADLVERTFQALRFNGILRQQGPARLTFPYPIVQEYLAACHLVRHQTHLLSSKIESAVSRPWAQVMQFAIELHRDPEPLIKEILEREEDAFYTGLRLVGRCLANGATVSARTHRRIGRRLVGAWLKAPSEAREAIGRLLCDAFTDDGLHELVEAVHRHELQYSGAGEIVVRINDPQLTLSVVKALTEQDPSSLKHYRALGPAIERVRVQALTLVRDLIYEADESERESRSAILSNFEPHADLYEIALQIARDQDLPVSTRLRAYALTPAPLGPDGQALLDEAIRTSQRSMTYEATCLLPQLENPQRYLAAALTSDEFSDEWKQGLVESLTGVIPDPDTRRAFLRAARAQVDEAQTELRSALDLVAAGAGDKAAIHRLIAGIDTMSPVHVRTSISLLGNYRDADLAEMAAQHARDRFNEPEDVVALANSAVIGMLYKMDLSFGFGGLLHHTQPHPGLAHWSALVDEWSQTPGLTDLQLLDVLTSACLLGVDEARIRLDRAVKRVDDPNDPKWNDGHSLGATTAHAVSELRRRTPLLDKDFLDKLLRSDQINLLAEGARAMSAHGDRDALERLLAAHREHPRWRDRDALANAIEALSLKLGLVVRRVEGQLEIAGAADGRPRG